jgi:hypothetical protein
MGVPPVCETLVGFVAIPAGRAWLRCEQKVPTVDGIHDEVDEQPSTDGSPGARSSRNDTRRLCVPMATFVGTRAHSETLVSTPEGSADRLDQDAPGDRLAEKGDRAGLEGAPARLLVPVRGQHDHGDARACLRQVLEQGEATHPL